MTEPKFQDLGAWLASRPVSSLVDRMREEPETMPTYTAADASQPAIVRAALDAALVSGVARPELDFGPIYVRMTTSGYWAVIAPRLVETHVKTTDQAVALIVATARGTL